MATSFYSLVCPNISLQFLPKNLNKEKLNRKILFKKIQVSHQLIPKNYNYPLRTLLQNVFVKPVKNTELWPVEFNDSSPLSRGSSSLFQKICKKVFSPNRIHSLLPPRSLLFSFTHRYRKNFFTQNFKKYRHTLACVVLIHNLKKLPVSLITPLKNDTLNGRKHGENVVCEQSLWCDFPNGSCIEYKKC